MENVGLVNHKWTTDSNFYEDRTTFDFCVADDFMLRTG